MKPFLLPLSLALSLVGQVSFFSNPAFAGSEESGKDEQVAGSASDSPASEPEKQEDPVPAKSEEGGRTIIKGGVRGTAVRTEEGLVTIEQSSKLVQTDALEVMKECTRKETIVMRGPNYIGNGIVLPAIGGDPTGVTKFGDLPARKEKLIPFIQGTEEAFKVLENHMDALILPEPMPEDIANIWNGMRTTLAGARENLDKLKELGFQVKFDKKQVGKHALRIYDAMTALLSMRERMHNALLPEKDRKE